MQDQLPQVPLPEQPALLASGARLDHYEILELLGTGGMGQVYLAHDTRLRRKVALKILPPELTDDERALRRFEQEAQAASALNHPNILTVYEFGQVDDLHFIAAEFVDGLTLRKKLSQSSLKLNAVIDIGVQIAGALTAAHSSGIVHRDIKPENVIVRTDGIVKVLDFGIAKLTESRAQTDGYQTRTVWTNTQPGTVVGTAKYMSPEQARGIAIDARSDLFSLGAVIYEMVAGRAAFEGETQSDVIAEILKGNPPPLADAVPECPAELEHIISRALRKDRDARYQTAEDLASDLRELKKEMEFEAKLHHSTSSAGSPQSRRAESSDLHISPPGVTIEAQLTAPASQSFRSYAGGHLTKRAVIAIAILLAAFAISYPVLRKWTNALSPAPRSLAVLPFRNLKQDPETDFLGFSLADAIITKLGYVNALTVRPSSSIDRYRNQVLDPQKVAAELRVDTLLTGSYIKEGDDLRINVQLIDVKPQKILWDDSIDVTYDKLLSVQDRVTRQIIGGLELKLSPAESERLKPDHPINALAYEYYLRGVDLYSTNNFSAAIEMLEKSASIDPSYPLTWAHLGRAFTTNASLQFGGREQYSKAQAAYEKALALDPALIQPRIYMANLFTDTGRVEQAVPLLRAVLKTNPNNAEAHWELGYAYRFGGMLKESVAEAERARQLDPEVKINSSAINTYLYLGEYDKFIRSLPANDSVYILFYRGLGEYYLGNHTEAVRDFERAFAVAPSLFQAQLGKALSDAVQGQNAEGLSLLRETERRIGERGVTDAEGIYKLGQAYAVLGDKSSALRMLRQSIEGGFFCYSYFVSDPLLRSLHNEPEYTILMNQARQRHLQFQRRFF